MLNREVPGKPLPTMGPVMIMRGFCPDRGSASRG